MNSKAYLEEILASLRANGENPDRYSYALKHTLALVASVAVVVDELKARVAYLESKLGVDSE